MEKLRVDAKRSGVKLKPYWKKLITAGRAKEGLFADWRDQLAEVQREIGFEYIRFHGIFHDDMMIYREVSGEPVFNFHYLDSLIDFLLSIELRPFLELGFMPFDLRSGEETCFWWKGGITPPKSLEKWALLVEETVNHCILRYGLEEVRKWYFEVWNEPNLREYFWAGDMQDYFELYRTTAKVLKKIDPELRVGGPATSNFTHGKAPWVEEFLYFCSSEGLPMDFISSHPYPNAWPIGDDGNRVLVYRDKWSTADDLKWLKAASERYGFGDAEIHATEWNSSFLPWDLVHDTQFMATFIVHNMIAAIGTANSLGFWTFTDIFEEVQIPGELFHGGFGLINQVGLKKPSYYAFLLLSRLGELLVDRGEDYIVTKSGETVQVMLWNYCHYDEGFANGDRSKLSPTARYDIFQEKEREVEIEVELDSGSYRVIETYLTRENSVFDLWLQRGQSDYLFSIDKEELIRDSEPSSHESEFSGSILTKRLLLKPHTVCMIEIERTTQE